MFGRISIFMTEVAKVSEEAVMVCRLRIPLPEGQTYFQMISKRHPKALFQVNGFLTINDEEVLIEVRIGSDTDLAEIAADVRGSPDVRTVDVLLREDTSLTLQVLSVLPETSAIRIQKGLKVVPHFPVFVKEGVLTILVAGPTPKIRELFFQVLRAFPGTTMESLRRKVVDNPEELLTLRQQELFRFALSSGYWDVPRRITLTDIATFLNLSKSTVSESLASVQSKLLHQATDHIYSPLHGGT